MAGGKRSQVKSPGGLLSCGSGLTTDTRRASRRRRVLSRFFDASTSIDWRYPIKEYGSLRKQEQHREVSTRFLNRETAFEELSRNQLLIFD